MSSTATSAEQGSAKQVNSRGRVIVASLIGTTVEFYDFYVYATAAVLVFPKLFFPGQNETTQLLASFAVFGVAFIARPLGSVVFGHFGDKFGRKGTLVASLLTMGIATFLIGCLPTATVPGWTFWAPALLVVLRFAQGLALGGEWSGAALLATENAPANKRAIYGTFPQLGAPIGFIIANVIFLVFSYTLTPEAFMDWGWRVPFLLSAVMVIIGLYVRLKLIETPAFTKVLESNEVAKLPLARVFKTSWRQLILGTFIMLATYVLFYLMTTFTLTYGTRAASLDAAKAAAEKHDKLGRRQSREPRIDRGQCLLSGEIRHAEVPGVRHRDALEVDVEPGMERREATQRSADSCWRNRCSRGRDRRTTQGYADDAEPSSVVRSPGCDPVRGAWPQRVVHRTTSPRRITVRTRSTPGRYAR